MAGPVNVEEQAILNGVLQDPSYAGYATLYIGLSSTTPAEDGTGITEPSTGAYARVATTAADWDAATGTAPATKANGAVKTFPTATADWLAGVNLTHFVLFDAPTAGNAKWFGALTVPKPVLNGDTASFAIGALVLKLGDPADTY